MVELNEIRSRAAAVAANADLQEVRLFRVESSLEHMPQGGGLSYSFEANVEVQQVSDTSSLIVDGNYEVVLTHVEDVDDEDEPAEGEPIATIRFQMAALFSLAEKAGDSPAFPDDELDAFAKTTGLLALHPYAREYISDLTSRMGLPTLHIATARIPLDKRNGD